MMPDASWLRRMVFALLLFAAPVIAVAQTHFEYAFHPGEVDYEPALWLRARLDQRQWDKGYREQGHGLLFTSIRYERMNRAWLTVDVFPYFNPQESRPVPEWIERQYDRQISRIQDQILLDGYRTERYLYQGILKRYEIHMPGQAPTQRRVTATHGRYLERLYVDIPGNPRGMRIMIKGEVNADGDAEGAVATELVRMRDEAMALVNSFTFSLDSSRPQGSAGLPWVVVAGGMAAVTAAGITLISKRNRKRKQGGDRTSPSTGPAEAPSGGDPTGKGDVAGYVLQLSEDRLTVTQEQPALLKATVWQVDGKGTPTRAVDASIRITAQPPLPELQISPAAAAGSELLATLSLQQPSTVPSTTLFVEATTPGGIHSAQVHVDLGGLRFRALVGGQKKATVRYDPKAKAWRFQDALVGFWSNHDGNWVQPSFTYGFPDPPFTAKPDILALDGTYSSDEGLTYIFRFSLKPGVDLDAVFGPDLKTHHDGVVRVTIGVQDEKGRPHQDSVEFQFVPKLRLMACTFDSDAGVPAKRTCCGMELEDLEVVADGKDELPVGIFFVRTDQDMVAGQEFRSAQTGIAIDNVQWNEEQRIMSDPSKCAKTAPEGVSVYLVKAPKPIMAREEHFEKPCILTVTPALNGEEQPEFESTPLEIRVKPLLPYIKLWIIPGQERGTSMAGAASMVMDETRKLRTAEFSDPLQLHVASQGPTLEVSETRHFIVTGQTRSSRAAVPEWLSAWKLNYRGLKWSTKDQGLFTVYCRLPGADEGVTFLININENMARMVRDLDAHAHSAELDLTNREWQSYSGMGMAGMLLARRECRGVVYNARELVVSTYCEQQKIPVDPRFRQYVCGAYSFRLRRYLIGRRNGAKDPYTALTMNGFEGCQYVVPSLHDWFGFHLSGTATTDEPLFIDPWWTQEWKIEEVKDNFGFKMQAALFSAVLTLLVAQLVLLACLVWWLIGAAWAGFGIVHPLKLGLPQIRIILYDLVVKKWYWQLSFIMGNLATWYLQTPCCDDTELFDDQFNYARYSELALFEGYRNDLLRASPPERLSLASWPATP